MPSDRGGSVYNCNSGRYCVVPGEPARFRGGRRNSENANTKPVQGRRVSLPETLCSTRLKPKDVGHSDSSNGEYFESDVEKMCPGRAMCSSV